MLPQSLSRRAELFELKSIIERELTPAPSKDAWSEIKSLLNRYDNGIHKLKDDEKQKLMHEWCDDLSPYPLFAIKMACAKWRQNPETVKYPPRGLGDLKIDLDLAIGKYRSVILAASKAIAAIENNKIEKPKTPRITNGEILEFNQNIKTMRA